MFHIDTVSTTVYTNVYNTYKAH